MTVTSDNWIDLSAPIVDGMTNWPDDPPVRIERALDVAQGDPASVTRLDMSAHTGTHVDAPAHFWAEGGGVETLPIDALVGDARVVKIDDDGPIMRDRLDALELRAGERLLIRTPMSDREWWSEPFHAEFPQLSVGAAELLAERGVALVGVDYLSVATPAADGERVHKALLNRGVVIVEGLRLNRLPSGRCELICLPIRVEGADGAPARAIARPLDGDVE